MTTMTPFHERLNEAAGKTSYRRLGKLTETHPETVRRYMQGQTPSSTYVMAFCDALGISGDWLLTGKGPKLRNEVRTHALKHADASELLNAIADTLTALTARVETMERFMQSIESRIGPMIRAMRPVDGMDPGILSSDERAPGQSTDLPAEDAIERIRGAIGGVLGEPVAQRASASAD
ncbi:MAG: hypothetical protein KC996_11130 [Phycisphaerales bacterium]|nr:hypothetical protein [Phycisphaerales bacterium]